MEMGVSERELKVLWHRFVLRAKLKQSMRGQVRAPNSKLVPRKYNFPPGIHKTALHVLGLCDEPCVHNLFDFVLLP